MEIFYGWMGVGGWLGIGDGGWRYILGDWGWVHLFSVWVLVEKGG